MKRLSEEQIQRFLQAEIRYMGTDDYIIEDHNLFRKTARDILAELEAEELRCDKADGAIAEVRLASGDTPVPYREARKELGLDEPSDDGTDSSVEPTHYECQECGIHVKACEDGTCAGCGNDVAETLCSCSAEPSADEVERVAKLLYRAAIQSPPFSEAAGFLKTRHRVLAREHIRLRDEALAESRAIAVGLEDRLAEGAARVEKAETEILRLDSVADCEADRAYRAEQERDAALEEQRWAVTRFEKAEKERDAARAQFDTLVNGLSATVEELRLPRKGEV